MRGEPADLDAYDPIEPDPAALRARALEAENAALAVDGVTNSSGASASASASTVALAISSGFAAAYRATGHSCSASVVAGEGSGMQRDYAYHTARHAEDLEDAGGDRPPRRNPGGGAAQSGQAGRGKDGDHLRTARRLLLARPFRRGDQRRVDRAQGELPPGADGRPDLRARRDDQRRSAAPARAAVAAVRWRGAAGARQAISSPTACSRPGSPTAPRRASSASSRPAMRCAASAARRARGRATCFSTPGRAAARNCSPLSRARSSSPN